MRISADEVPSALARLNGSGQGGIGEGDSLDNDVPRVEARGKNLRGVEGRLPEIQCQNLVLTVLYVPYSLGSGGQIIHIDDDVPRVEASAAVWQPRERHRRVVPAAQTSSIRGDRACGRRKGTDREHQTGCGDRSVVCVGGA